MTADATTPESRQPRESRLAAVGRSDKGLSNTLILPSRILLLFIIAFPSVVAIYISFTEWSPASGAEWWQAYQYWGWFDKYWEALSDASFWLAIWRTVLVTVIAVGVEFGLGLLLALLFVENFRGRNFLTVLFLLPMMVVPAVSGFIFYMLLQQEGPLNQILSYILPGDIRIGWLSNPDIALYSVMMVDIWQWTPLMFLILLAGVVSIPEDQMNAARILGAGFWQRFRYLMFPLLKPVILIALIIRAMETFKIFDQSWLLTKGGPGEASTTISVFLYREVFINARWGFATACGILVLILVSVAALRAIRPIEVAQEESLEDLITESARAADEPAETPAEAGAKA